MRSGAFKTGEQSIDWKLKKVLRALRQILHDLPVELRITLMWPELVNCDTRWLKDEQVAVWAIEILGSYICQPCTCWQSLPKSRWPSSQSYLTLLSATKDPLILAKLYFFSYIAGTIKPFLTEYQYTKPMMSFTYDDLRQLLRDIVSKYIKS